MAMLIELIEQDEALALPDWARDEFAGTDPRQFQLTLEANGGDPDPWDALGTIAAATVLIAGALEDPDNVQALMAEAMLNARSVHLPGVGHVGAFLRPEQVTAAALPTLRRAASI